MDAAPSGEGNLRELTAQFETEVITRAVRDAGSIRKAAGRLSISHTTLINKIKKYGITVETNRSTGSYSFQ